jgi:hypothetical protein
MDKKSSFENLFRNRAIADLDAVWRFGRFLLVSMAEATVGIKGTSITTMSNYHCISLPSLPTFYSSACHFFYIHFSLSFDHRT